MELHMIQSPCAVRKVNRPVGSLFMAGQNRLQILSLDFGRELRNLINSEEYRRIFSVSLAPDARAAWRWP